MSLLDYYETASLRNNIYFADTFAAPVALVTLAIKCIIAFGCTADEEVFIQV